MFITLCMGCRGQGIELATEGVPSEPSTSGSLVPYRETYTDWRKPLIQYLTQVKITVGTITRREHREIIRKKRVFHDGRRETQKTREEWED